MRIPENENSLQGSAPAVAGAEEIIIEERSDLK
jgi:hypothetical protein